MHGVGRFLSLWMSLPRNSPLALASSCAQFVLLGLLWPIRSRRAVYGILYKENKILNRLLAVFFIALIKTTGLIFNDVERRG